MGGSDVAGYEVQWRSGGQGWDTGRRRVVLGLSHVIGGLDDGTEYTIRVRPAAVETAEVEGASIAAGAGSGPTAEIVRDAAALPGGYRSISTLAGPVDFEMSGEAVWPATISIPVDMGLIGEDSAVQLAYYNESLEAWVQVTAAVLDRELGAVTAEVYHLSRWQPICHIPVAGGVCGAAATVSTRAPALVDRYESISWQSAGDSYSSGQGLSERHGPCARSRLAYGPEAVRELRARGWDIGPVTFTACSGSVTEQYFNSWSTPWGPSVPETIAICGGNTLCLLALPRGTHTIGSQWRQGLDQGGPERVDIIVMSFGGNDVGFEGVITECVILVLPPGCVISEQEVKSRIDNLVDPPAACLGPRYELSGSPRYECDLDLGTSRGSIVDFYESIVTDRLTSRGKLFVVGYPRLFAPVDEWPRVAKRVCQWILRGDTEQLGRSAEYLDEKLRDAVDMANSRLGAADRIHYLDLLSFYRDNKAELCGTNHDWLDGLRAPPDTTCCSFHPNATGHYKTATKLADLIAQEWPAAACPPPPGQGLIAYGADDSVWIADPDTGNRCPAAAGGSHPAWSPDGTRLAFAHHADRAIKVLDLETRRVSTVVPYLNTLYAYVVEAAHDLAWSPSGDEIAFTALSGGDYDIVIANSDGTRTWRKLTDSPTTGEYQPSWSPDGTKIAYASNRDGDNDIYITNADGTGTPRNITDGTRTAAGRTLSDGNETYPAWANDGRIAFTSDRGDRSGASDIYIVLDENDTTWANLTNTRGHDQTHPAWSPDGTQMTFAYRTPSTGTYDIWRVDLPGGGTNWTAIAQSATDETNPRWAPSIAATENDGEPQITLEWVSDTYTFDEDATNAVVKLRATADGTAKPVQDLVITVETRRGTASPTDFIPFTDTVTFTAADFVSDDGVWALIADVGVELLADDILEVSERFFLIVDAASLPEHASVPSTASYTTEIAITDTSGPATLRVSNSSPDLTVVEGTSWTLCVEHDWQVQFYFSVTAIADTANSAGVSDPATLYEDYRVLYDGRTVYTFDAYDLKKCAEFLTLWDELAEGSEQLSVAFTSSHPRIAVPDPVTITIIDGDEPTWHPGGWVDQINEAGGSTELYSCAFSLAEGVTIEFELTLGGTATVGRDYTIADADGRALSAPHTFICPRGDAYSEEDIIVTSVDDADVEGDETVELTASYNGTVIGTLTITIKDNDAGP